MEDDSGWENYIDRGSGSPDRTEAEARAVAVRSNAFHAQRKAQEVLNRTFQSCVGISKAEVPSMIGNPHEQYLAFAEPAPNWVSSSDPEFMTWVGKVLDICPVISKEVISQVTLQSIGIQEGLNWSLREPDLWMSFSMEGVAQTYNLNQKEFLFRVHIQEKPSFERQLCNLLGVAHDASSEVIYNKVLHLAEENYEAKRTLAPYCPEADPGRLSLLGVIKLLQMDVLDQEELCPPWG